MKGTVKKTQKSVVRYYIDELKGMKALTAEDIIQMIDEAKAIKSMCYNEALGGNQGLIHYYIKIGEFILKCYEGLPEEKVSETEKTSIEQALDVLWGTMKK